MADVPAWLPDQLEFAGDWPTLLQKIYSRFVEDTVRNKLTFRGRPIAVRKHPPLDGKEFGFWHCISEGAIEANRIPDPERCRRIGWIRAIIQNSDDPLVEHWVEQRGGQTDHVIWFREEYVIILSERGKGPKGGPDCYLLKTAFCTPLPHQRRKKRMACEAARKKANAAREDGV